LAKIDFLSVIHDQDTLPTMNHLLEQFKQKYGHSVQGTFVDWDMLWREITNVGIYKKGADIAEIGSTWLDGLVAMNCLRPFTYREIAQLGGKDAFLAPNWSSVLIGEGEQVWGIPVRSDVRILWYWEDMLEQAKLDPQTAFSSFEQFPETFEKLKTVVPTPWAIIMAPSDANSLQTMASWVWDAGGEFVSKDGKKFLFVEPAARQGMRAFFDLYRYMPKTLVSLSGNETGRLFAERKVCATIGGPWLLVDLAGRKVSTDRVKAAMIPGQAFVGGTAMVIYEHSRVAEAAVNFLEFITSPEIQLQYGPIVSLLPTRHQAWNVPPLSDNPLYQTLYRALSQGRSYPSVPLWGVIEQKLLSALGDSWNAIRGQEHPDIDAVIDENFVSLARRLELTFNS
jgi:multiple sugar transport system substrate-binding protein